MSKSFLDEIEDVEKSEEIKDYLKPDEKEKDNKEPIEEKEKEKVDSDLENEKQVPNYAFDAVDFLSKKEYEKSKKSIAELTKAAIRKHINGEELAEKPEEFKKEKDKKDKEE